MMNNWNSDFDRQFEADFKSVRKLAWVWITFSALVSVAFLGFLVWLAVALLEHFKVV